MALKRASTAPATPYLAAGDLRHPLGVEQAALSRDANGNPVVIWSAYGTVWASIENYTGFDPLSGERQGRIRTHLIHVRHDAGLLPYMRANFGSRVFYFESILNMAERSMVDEIIAIETTPAAAVVFSRPTESAYDPTTEQSTPGATITATTQGSAIDPSTADVLSYEARGWKFTETIILFIDAPALGAFIPKPDDSLMWAGLPFAVRESRQVGPSGVPLFYRIVAAR